MSRTKKELVIAVLMDDYGPKADGSTPDLSPRIDTATVIVDRVNVCAVAKNIALTGTELELIERWLAAHFYAIVDKPYQSKSTGGASASFQGQTGMRLETTHYGQTAMNVDYSGCLENINKRQFGRSAWLGKPANSQLSWDQRNC